MTTIPSQEHGYLRKLTSDSFIYLHDTLEKRLRRGSDTKKTVYKNSVAHDQVRKTERKNIKGSVN